MEQNSERRGRGSGVWQDPDNENRVKKSRMKLRILKEHFQTTTGSKLKRVNSLDAYQKAKIAYFKANPAAEYFEDDTVLREAGFKEIASQLNLPKLAQTQQYDLLSDTEPAFSEADVDSSIGLDPDPEIAAAGDAEGSLNGLEDDNEVPELDEPPESDSEDDSVPELPMNQFMRDLKTIKRP